MNREHFKQLAESAIWDGVVIGGVCGLVVLALANLVVLFS